MAEITLTPDEALALKRLQKWSGATVEPNTLCSLDDKGLIVASEQGWTLTFLGHRAFRRRAQ